MGRKEPIFTRSDRRTSLLRSKGSVEEELGDGVAKYAKIRPMRVEMYGMNCRQNLSRRGELQFALTTIRPNGQNPFQFIPCIAADSGETTQLEMILAVLIHCIEVNDLF